MSRVERSTDQQLNAFSLFETAISLDQQVRNRTQQLKQALQSLEKTNGSLSQAKQQAEAASSLKSSVLISVTHDLLQPLNAARLTLSALEEMIASPKGLVLTEQIDRSLATLEDLLRTLLDISKLDAGVLKPEFRPVAISTLFEVLRQEFTPVAARRHLVLKIRPCAETVLSDPMMLRRILRDIFWPTPCGTRSEAACSWDAGSRAPMSAWRSTTRVLAFLKPSAKGSSWNFSAGKPVLATTRGSASVFQSFGVSQPRRS